MHTRCRGARRLAARGHGICQTCSMPNQAIMLRAQAHINTNKACTHAAEELGASLHVASASDVFGAYLGESEGRLRAVFEAAQRDADEGRMAVVFLDEVGCSRVFV